MVYAFSASANSQLYNRLAGLWEQSGTSVPRSKTSSNSTTTVAVFQASFYATITSFKNLEDGWNGDKAKAIPLSVINSALNMLEKLPKEGLKIFPTGRESIQFEYDNGGKTLEIEIFKNQFEVTLFDDINLVSEGTYRISKTEEIEQYFNKLYEQQLHQTS